MDFLELAITVMPQLLTGLKNTVLLTALAIARASSSGWFWPFPRSMAMALCDGSPRATSVFSGGRPW